MAHYVKAQGSDTWHWCRNCTSYPSQVGSTHDGGRPSSGELCDQCKGKEHNNNCSS